MPGREREGTEEEGRLARSGEKEAGRGEEQREEQKGEQEGEREREHRSGRRSGDEHVDCQRATAVVSVQLGKYPTSFAKTRYGLSRMPLFFASLLLGPRAMSAE